MGTGEGAGLGEDGTASVVIGTRPSRREDGVTRRRFHANPRGRSQQLKVLLLFAETIRSIQLRHEVKIDKTQADKGRGSYLLVTVGAEEMG